MNRTCKQRTKSLTCESLEDRRMLAVGYSLIDLGGLPGLSQLQSSAVSINETGDIAGNSYTARPTPTGTSRHPVVWHRDAGGAYQITDLGFPTSPNVAANGFALDINDQGEVLGTASTDVGSYVFLVRPEDTNNDGRPDRWYRDANSDGLNDLMINLTALNSQINNIGASAINGRGQIIGSYGLAQFDASGALITITNVTGQDINSTGQIVGGGKLWQVDAAGSVVAGPTSLGFVDVLRPESINSSGNAIAGGYQLWQSGTLKTLGSLGGGNTTTLAAAVNDASQVVGKSALKSKETQAFLWQNGAMSNLNSVLPRNSGWKLDFARGLNNSGWIVGDGRVTNAKGITEAHGFLMIPSGASGNLNAVSTGPGVDDVLATDDVPPIVTEALARWQAAGENVAWATNLQVKIADLGGTRLGAASNNTIWLDDNGAGWGWFVDPTPDDDMEFVLAGNQGEQNRIDLLTVVMHELGHLLGHDHDEDGLMAETLAVGVRQTELYHDDASLADQVFRRGDDHRANAWLGAWLNEQFDAAHGRAKLRR